MRHWYRFTAQAEGDTAELSIYGEIGASFWGEQTVTAKQFIADLAALPNAVTTLRVHVNSPGGDVFDAVAIANALRAQSKDKGRMVEMSIEGLAASAATIVTSAGDSIQIADNALIVVHNPKGFVMGGAADMRATAEALDRVRAAIVATYQWVSQLSAEALGALMDQTTWMTAEEAVANGFATEIVSGVKVTACFRPEALDRLGAIPAAYRAKLDALIATPAPVPAPPAPPEPADAKTVIKACRGAGHPELAEDLLGLPMEAVTAKLAEAAATRAAAETRAAEIRASCATAKFPDLADHYIRGGMSVAEVKAQLTVLTAKRDVGVIDPSAPPEKPQPAPVAADLNPSNVYRARHAIAVKGA